MGGNVNWDPVVWIVVGIAGLIVLMLTMVTAVFRFEARMEKPKRPGEAESILENRYALGEIDDDEFRHRMDVLREERRRSARSLSPAS